MWGSYPNGGYSVPWNAQPMTPVQQQNYANQPSGMIFDFVQGDDAARNFPLPPNGKAILMDMNNCMMYSKIADSFGKIDMRKFKFSEIPFGVQLQEEAPKVTVDDFKQMNERLARIEEMLKEHSNNG